MARLRARERLLLTVGLSVVGVLLLTLLVFFPQVRRAAVVQLDVGRKQAELRRGTALANQREEIERKNAAAKQAAQTLVARIPAEPDLPDLIIRLDQALAFSGVRLLQISFLSGAPQTAASPGTERPLDSLPLQLRVRGTYPQMQTLVRELEDSARLVVIDRVALTGTETGIIADLALRALFLR